VAEMRTDLPPARGIMAYARRGAWIGPELARLCARGRPYRWLCGGVTLNHHSLSTSRGARGGLG